MAEVVEVSSVVALLVPMFREMLLDDEFASLRLGVVAVHDHDGRDLDGSDLVEEGSAVVRWRILGERGSSGGLHVDNGGAALVRAVQSDLQDFIAERRFGWGQLRGPRDLP